MTVIQTSRGPVELREIKSVAEMVEAEQIQVAVWGADVSPHPKEMLIASQFEGALVAGAFAVSGQMIGLVYSFPTRDPGVMHSQLLATLEDWRGMGIGARLKWFQREWCLERRINLIRWTVDPLRAANAELNIRHLGGTASRYFPDYYGPMLGIDAGVPTDRLLLEWQLDSPRVADLSAATPPDVGYPQACAVNQVEDGRLRDARLDLTEEELLVRIPEDFIRLSKFDPSLALEWRLQTREILMNYFAHGYEIRGFTRVGGPAYLLRP